MPCVFCDDPHAAGDVVLDDPAALVLVHPDWATPGHLMVAARRHVENLSGLSDAEARAFLEVYRRAERAVLDLTDADRAIVMKLGIQTPHLHLHIYPVPASLDRAQVMAMIDARSRAERDETLIERLAEALS